MSFRQTLHVLVIPTVLSLVAPPALAAETVHLTLSIGGKIVKGDSTVHSLGRKDTIECSAFEARMAAGKGSGTILFTKPIDRSSTALVKALRAGTVVQGNFRFYRPSPTGDGTTQHFHTVGFSGRIAGLKQVVRDTMNPPTASLPPLDEVTLSLTEITTLP